MINLIRNFFFPQTIRTLAELPSDQFFMFRGLNKSGGCGSWKEPRMKKT